jgi:hypothetical protein
MRCVRRCWSREVQSHRVNQLLRRERSEASAPRKILRGMRSRFWSSLRLRLRGRAAAIAVSRFEVHEYGIFAELGAAARSSLENA